VLKLGYCCLLLLLMLLIYSVHFAGLLDIQNFLSADTGISQQTGGHSFGDQLTSKSVSAMPSNVIEASTVLCSVSLWLVWVSVQSACALNTLYKCPHCACVFELVGCFLVNSVLCCVYYFPQFLNVSSGVIFRLGLDHFLPNPTVSSYRIAGNDAVECASKI
jgi:hypothetical protein